MNSEFEQFELRIAHLLRYGVLLAGAFLLAGWLASLPTHDVYTALAHYQQQGFLLRLQSGIGWPEMLEYVGLALLAALPSIRVLCCVILLWRQGSRALSLVALTVCVLIAFSLAMGLEA